MPSGTPSTRIHPRCDFRQGSRIGPAPPSLEHGPGRRRLAHALAEGAALRLDGASHKHLAKQERPVAGVVDDMPMRKKRRAAAWDDADPADLRARLDQATTRAKEAEEAARSLAASLQQATDRL